MTSGTTTGATEESILDPSCDAGVINDIWYSFNTGNNTSINITVTLGTAIRIGGQLFSSCGTVSSSPSFCDFNLLSPSPTVITGLTTNTTYLLRIFTNTTYESPGTFNIRINAANYTLTSGTHNTTVITACDGYNPPALTISTPTNGFPTYNYQWNLNGTSISGQTSSVFDPTNLGVGSYSYTCTTTDACGLTATSATKLITVVADPSSTAPNNLSQCIGESGSISVSGSGGTPSLNYQWYSNTTNSNTGGTLISGSNSSSFTPPSLSSGTNYYYCVISATGNSCNNSNSPTSTVTINSPSATSINLASGQTLSNGDYLWDGSSSTAWGTSGNWYVYNGTSFDVATTDPTSSSNVFIVPNSTTQCISSSNSPTLTIVDDVTNLTVVSGATLDISNTISLTGNLKIDGTITGSGTIKLNGTGTQNISGTGTITIPNLEVNKSTGNVTLSNPIKVSKCKYELFSK
jgi:hypothetical protein